MKSHLRNVLADISEYLISLGISEDRYSARPNATEKWLIINQTKLMIPAEPIIYPKHRLKYGLGWKSPVSYQYPGHKVGK